MQVGFGVLGTGIIVARLKHVGTSFSCSTQPFNTAKDVVGSGCFPGVDVGENPVRSQLECLTGQCEKLSLCHSVNYSLKL